MNLRAFNFRDPSSALRIILGTLVVLNLIAAGLVMFPPGGSPEQMQAQLQTLQTQILQGRNQLQRTRAIAGKLDRGRNEGDQFMDQYFLNSSTTYSTIVNELVTSAKRAGIKFKEHSYVTEPIEGSDDLTMMAITGAYEGSYSDLLHYVNEIDRTRRLLIIENLSAQPQQGSGGVLAVSIRFDTFVKEKPMPAQSASAVGTQLGAGQ
jgi:Tfp pilus assembly protein PilO